MDWMDTNGAGYLAWVWDVWGSPLDLIRSYDGTPTSYGQTFKTRFRQVGITSFGTQILSPRPERQAARPVSTPRATP
jgi:hypothetical protein